MRFKSVNPILYVVISAFALNPLGCVKAPKAARQIAVSMKKYSIEPAEIHVKWGETVEFHVSSLDVQHGFDVPALGIKQSVQPTRPAVFSFTADQQREFEVNCVIICGPGHD